MLKIFSYILIIFITGFCLCASAKVENLRLEKLSVEHGLSQGTINSFLQDDQGFVWIGTDNGVNMYDGYRFRQLPGPDGDFSEYGAYKIFQDSDNLLWFNISGKGLYTYDKQEDIYYKVIETDPVYPEHYISDIVEGTNQQFYLITSKTILVFDKKTNKISPIFDLNSDLVDGYFYRAFLHQGLLIVTSNKGLYAFNLNKNIWKKLPEIDFSEELGDLFNKSNSNHTYDISVMKDNTLFIGSDEGVFSLDIKSLKGFIDNTQGLPSYKMVIEGISTWLFFEEKDQLLIGSHLGLYQIDTVSNKPKFMFSYNEAYDDIGEKVVRAVMVDNLGGYWLGSATTGIYRWQPNHSLISNYRYKKNSSNSLANNVVIELRERKKYPEQLLVGTDNGFSIVDTKYKTTRSYLSGLNLKGFNEVNRIEHIYEDQVNEDLLWLSTGKSVYLFDTEKEKLIDLPFDGRAKELLELYQYTFSIDKFNTIWSHTEVGANRISIATGEVDPLDELLTEMQEMDSYNFLGYFPQTNKMMVSTNDTLWFFDVVTRELSQVYQHEGITESEWSYFDEWTIDDKGILWLVLSTKGLIGLDSQTFERKYFYNNRNSNVDHNIYSPFKDRDGDVWFSSHSGIYMLNTDNQFFRNFSIDDGLVAKEFNGGAGYQMSNGNLAYGSINGVSIFDPIKIKKLAKNQKINIVATSIEVLSRELALPFTFSQNKQKIELNYDDVGIRIDFSTLTFNKHDAFYFHYKLTGDKQVEYPKTRDNSITFPSLPSGEHQLEVRVESPFTGQLTEPFVLNFTVSYAPWSSPFAYLVYFILLVSIFIFWLSRRRMHTKILLAAHEEVKFRENRLQLALTGSNSEVWDWQSHNNMMFAKRASEELGYANLKQSYSFEQHLELIHPHEKEFFRNQWFRFLEQADIQESFSCSYRMKKSDKSWLWFKDLGKIVAVDAQGKPSRVTGAYTNITQSLADAERAQFYGEAFKQTKDWVLIISDDFSRVIANQSLREVFQWPEEDFSFDPKLFGLSKDRGEFYFKLFSNLKAGDDWRGEELIKTAQGDEYHVIVTINANQNQSTNSLHYVCIFTDITAQKNAEQELRYLANYDHLTELPNRSLLLDRIKHAMDYSARTQAPIALFFIDLDRFKQVNDSLGHDYGDLLLQEVTQRLTSVLRVDDTVARIGGDEFVVLLESFRGNNQLGRIAQKIISTVGEPFTLNDSVVSVGASIGIAIFPNDAKNSDELLRHADIAMYHSKQLGRNTFQFFTPQLNIEASERLILESKLKRAQEEQQFLNHYQPVVDSHTGKAVGVELLLRWQSEGELVPPFKFIPTAEELGLIIPMTEDAICRGLNDLRQWQAIRPDFYLSVNLSVQHLVQESLLPFLTRILEKYDICPRTLKFEVTESMLISEPEKAIATLQALSKLGVVIALDDFGTGYSSLSYLKQLPLDILKIDRSFVIGIGDDKADEAIIEATIALANSLKMKCIAEGVENLQQLKFLAEKNCHLIQGYLYSKPVNSSVIIGYLTADKVEVNVSD